MTQRTPTIKCSSCNKSPLVRLENNVLVCAGKCDGFIFSKVIKSAPENKESE